MNKYEFTCIYNKRKVNNKINALTLEDAYEKAGRLIIDNFEDISEDSCSVLDSATMNNWKSEIIPFLKKSENMTLSDVQEITDEE